MSRALFISVCSRLHSDSIFVSFQVRGRGGRFWRRDLKSCQSAVFQILMGEAGGVDKCKFILMATWSLRDGVSCILQLESALESDGSVKVRSMIVADLWFEKVGALPLFWRSAPILIMNSSRVFPLGLSLLQPHRVLWALESIEQMYGRLWL